MIVTSGREATSEMADSALRTVSSRELEIRCRFIILARKDEPTPDYARKDEPTPDYARKDEPTSRQEARERCVGLSAISSLLQKGDSRVMSLGHPSYPRPK